MTRDSTMMASSGEDNSKYQHVDVDVDRTVLDTEAVAIKDLEYSQAINRSHLRPSNQHPLYVAPKEVDTDAKAPNEIEDPSAVKLKHPRSSRKMHNMPPPSSTELAGSPESLSSTTHPTPSGEDAHVERPKPSRSTASRISEASHTVTAGNHRNSVVDSSIASDLEPHIEQAEQRFMSSPALSTLTRAMGRFNTGLLSFPHPGDDLEASNHSNKAATIAHQTTVRDSADSPYLGQDIDQIQPRFMPNPATSILARALANAAITDSSEQLPPDCVAPSDGDDFTSQASIERLDTAQAPATLSNNTISAAIIRKSKMSFGPETGIFHMDLEDEGQQPQQRFAPDPTVSEFADASANGAAVSSMSDLAISPDKETDIAEESSLCSSSVVNSPVSLDEGRFTFPAIFPTILPESEPEMFDMDLDGTTNQADQHSIPNPIMHFNSEGTAQRHQQSFAPNTAVSRIAACVANVDDRSEEPSASSFDVSTTSSDLDNSSAVGEYNHSASNRCHGTSPSNFDPETTIVTINGHQVALPGSEFLFFPREEELPGSNSDIKVFPSFTSLLLDLGPDKTIEAMRGRQLFVQTPFLSSVSTNSADQGSPPTEKEDLICVSSISITSCPNTTGSLGEILNAADTEPSVLTANIATKKDDYGSGEMDGADSVEKASVAKLSPRRFTASPFTIASPASTTGSVNDFIASGFDGKPEYELQRALENSNILRAEIKNLAIPVSIVEEIDEMLEQLSADEVSLQVRDLGWIAYARLDKLLKEIFERKRAGKVSVRFEGLLGRAFTLEGAWKQRSRLESFSFEEERQKMMTSRGALRGVSLDRRNQNDGTKWAVHKGTPIAESDLAPGHWWLSVHCALRDGIVNTSSEVVTKGKYTVPVLPLLTGTEVEGPVVGTYKYSKEGSLRETHVGLLLDVGKKVRVLRGHTLRSRYAPIAGIRYDGEYSIKQYGHKLVEDKNIYRLDLILERLPDQLTVIFLRQIPYPSQLDDWVLYKKMIGDSIRSHGGNKAYSEWKAEEVRQENERQEWEKSYD